MAKDATADEAQTAHDEKIGVSRVPQSSPQEDLKTDVAPGSTSGRRKSVALNIVQNPLTVGSGRSPATAISPFPCFTCSSQPPYPFSLL